MRNAVAASLLGLLMSGPAAADVDTARQTELLYLLKHDCGSCHGMRRLGGLGAPLNAETLAGRSDDDLTGIILDGMPGTPMPPWRPFINPDEARWLVHFLRNGGNGQ
jgi:cytochrome c55X